MVVKKEEGLDGKLTDGWIEDAKEVLGTRRFAVRDGNGDGKGTSGNDTVGQRRRDDADSEVKATTATLSFQYNIKKEVEEGGGEETEKRRKKWQILRAKTNFHLHFGVEPTTPLFTVFCCNGNTNKKWAIKREFSSLTSHYRNLQWSVPKLDSPITAHSSSMIYSWQTAAIS